MTALGEESPGRGFLRRTSIMKMGLGKFWGDDLKWLEFELAAHD